MSRPRSSSVNWNQAPLDRPGTPMVPCSKFTPNKAGALANVAAASANRNRNVPANPRREEPQSARTALKVPALQPQYPIASVARLRVDNLDRLADPFNDFSPTQHKHLVDLFDTPHQRKHLQLSGYLPNDYEELDLLRKGIINQEQLRVIRRIKKRENLRVSCNSYLAGLDSLEQPREERKRTPTERRNAAAMKKEREDNAKAEAEAKERARLESENGSSSVSTGSMVSPSRDKELPTLPPNNAISRFNSTHMSQPRGPGAMASSSRPSFHSRIPNPVRSSSASSSQATVTSMGSPFPRKKLPSSYNRSHLGGAAALSASGQRRVSDAKTKTAASTANDLQSGPIDATQGTQSNNARASINEPAMNFPSFSGDQEANVQSGETGNVAPDTSEPAENHARFNETEQPQINAQSTQMNDAIIGASESAEDFPEFNERGEANVDTSQQSSGTTPGNEAQDNAAAEETSHPDFPLIDDDFAEEAHQPYVSDTAPSDRTEVLSGDHPDAKYGEGTKIKHSKWGPKLTIAPDADDVIYGKKTPLDLKAHSDVKDFGANVRNAGKGKQKAVENSSEAAHTRRTLLASARTTAEGNSANASSEAAATRGGGHVNASMTAEGSSTSTASEAPTGERSGTTGLDSLGRRRSNASTSRYSGIPQRRRASREAQFQENRRTSQEARRVYNNAGILPPTRPAPLPPRTSSLPNSPATVSPRNFSRPAAAAPPASVVDRLSRPTNASAARAESSRRAANERTEKTTTHDAPKKATKSFRSRINSLLPSRRRNSKKSEGPVDSAPSSLPVRAPSVNLTTFRGSGINSEGPSVTDTPVATRSLSGGVTMANLLADGLEAGARNVSGGAIGPVVGGRHLRNISSPMMPRSPSAPRVGAGEELLTPPQSRDGPLGHHGEGVGGEAGADESGLAAVFDQAFIHYENVLDRAIADALSTADPARRARISAIVQSFGENILQARSLRSEILQLQQILIDQVSHLNETSSAIEQILED